MGQKCARFLFGPRKAPKYIRVPSEFWAVQCVPQFWPRTKRSRKTNIGRKCASFLFGPRKAPKYIVVPSELWAVQCVPQVWPRICSKLDQETCVGSTLRLHQSSPNKSRAASAENLSTFWKVGRQCIFHFKISASRDDWLRFFFYPFSFACILGMEHVQPWEPGRDWKSNMIGQIHMHRVACRMEVSNFKLVFLSIVSSNFNSV